MLNSKNIKSALTFFILCFCYMVPNYAQYQVSPLGSRIMDEYSIQLSQLSALFSAPMIPAIFLSLIAGLMLDRYSTRNVIGIVMVITVIGCIGRIFSANYISLLLSTMLIGFSATFINAGAGKIISGLYKPEKISFRMGLLMGASTAAMTISNLTSAWFSNIKAAFSVSAILALIAVLLWLVLTEDISKKVYNSKDCETNGSDLEKCLRVCICNAGVWCIAFALFFLMASNVVVSSFLPTALKENGVGELMAGLMAAFYTAGNLVGCLIGPIIADKIRNWKKSLLIFAIIGALGVSFAWMLPCLAVQAVALLFTGTCFGSMIPILMAIPVQLEGIGCTYAGTAGGIIGTIQLLGAVLVPSYILTPIANGSFSTLFILGGVCVFIAGCISCFINNFIE